MSGSVQAILGRVEPGSITKAVSGRALLLGGAALALIGVTAAVGETLVHRNTLSLAPNVSMLTGYGGNMALVVGKTQALLIDDQTEFNAGYNLLRIESQTFGKQVFIVNTHWHWDHSGGNPLLQSAGMVVIAQDNVRKRLTGETPETPHGEPSSILPEAGWPTITFSKSMDLHLDGETARIIAVPGAHTDGDVLVDIVNANVLVMGDLFLNGAYPNIDREDGGTLTGYIAAQKQALALAGPDTRIVPGHGKLGSKADLEAELAMIEGSAAAVKACIDAGDTLEQTLAAHPLASWTAKYADPAGGEPEDEFVSTLYKELTKDDAGHDQLVADRAPQTEQAGSAASAMVRPSPVSPSNSQSRPARLSPAATSSLTVSSANRAPTKPVSGPTTPTAAQVSSFSGASFTRQR